MIIQASLTSGVIFTMKKLPLHPYQIKAQNFILKHKSAGLFLDVGMGKSLITLSALLHLKPENTLIIAPKAIARSTWIDEINKWQLPFPYQSLIVNKNDKKLTRKQREKLYESVLETNHQMYFLNRDLVQDCATYFKKNHNTWPFKYVIIDESQSFKSPSSRRFKALKSVRSQISRLIELTGTPTPNSLLDLWSQIYLLDEGKSLGRTMSAYKANFFKPVLYVQNHPVKWQPLKSDHYNAETDIYKRIKPFVISMKNTALKLPKVTYSKDTVYLSKSQKNIYQKMLKDKVLPITPNLDVTAQNAAVLSNKLSQMASGSLYIDEEQHFIKIHDAKLERLKYIIENTQDCILIAYHYQSDKILIQDYLDKNNILSKTFDGSPDMINQWNSRQIPVMLIQPASAGFGLNLQNGGHTLVWHTLPWSLEQYIQTNGRLNRQGQKHPVIIHHLITANTIDLQILKALQNKDLTQTRLMQAVNISLK